MLVCKDACEFGFGTVPNGVDEELDSWNRLIEEMRWRGKQSGTRRAPDREDVGDLGSLPLRVIIDVVF